MLRLVTIALALLVALPAAAQELHTPRTLQTAAPTAVTDDHPEPQIIHVTDELMQRPEARRALERYQELKAAGYYEQVAPKRLDEVGDTLAFRVLNLQSNEYENHSFVLKAIQDKYKLWVEVASLDSNYVRQQDIDDLVEWLSNSTPSSSVNPNEGVIVNNEAYFGTVPDVDGSGKSDVLWVDVRDGAEAGDPYTAGFVDPSHGNGRDILYLDTYPALYNGSGYNNISGVAATAAHEYQHLIHTAYDVDEATFTNEGLSEYAEVINGFGIRPPVYLNDPAEYNVDMVEWKRNSSRVLYDYQRAGAFTNYLGDRFGVLETAVMTQDPRNYNQSYSELLNRVGATDDLEEVIADFHTANYAMDSSVDPDFAYDTPGRADFRAALYKEVDARTDSPQPAQEEVLQPAGVLYFGWSNVTDLSLTVDAVPADPSRLTQERAKLSMRALLTDENGVTTWQELELREDPTVFQGTFSQIVLVASHVKPVRDEATFTYAADWAAGEQDLRTESTLYDNGDLTGVFSTQAAADQQVATLFDVPEGESNSEISIDQVRLPLIFDDQLSETPGSPPRDFTLKVWGVAADGAPGEEIFSQTYENRFSSPTITIDFVDLDLSDANIGPLPDSVFIGWTEAGTDDNYTLVPYGDFATDVDPASVSYLGNASSGSWTELWSVELTNGSTLDQTVTPVRATFLISTPVANEDTFELPGQLVLEPNAPNPVRARTTIGYELPTAGAVTMQLYDMLGRRIATLVDTELPAGAHTVEFDASGLSSGVYFYRLESNGHARSEKMLVVR